MSDPQNNIVILIGNGLGRSFDNEGFATELILKKMEDPSSELEIETKRFLEKFFRTGFPNKEDDLGKLEEIYEALNLLEDSPFSIIFHDYLKNSNHIVDKSFRNEFKQHYQILKNHFLKIIKDNSAKLENDTTFRTNICPFVEFVDNNGDITISTLNYDSLLYISLLKSQKFKEDYTDGFVLKKNNNPLNDEDKASEPVSVPTFQNDFFHWIIKGRKAYLHLHGAYFYEIKNGTKVAKKQLKELSDYESLVILTSQKRKIEKIYQSPQQFLHTYSHHFFEKILEANHLIIFGYSGSDEYLNADMQYAISKKQSSNNDFKITILCREGDMSDENLIKKWNNCLIRNEKTFCVLPNNDRLLQQQAPFVIHTCPSLQDFGWQ